VLLTAADEERPTNATLLDEAEVEKAAAPPTESNQTATAPVLICIVERRFWLDYFPILKFLDR